MANPIKQLIRAGMAATLPRRRFMVSGPRSGNAVLAAGGVLRLMERGIL